MIYVCANSKASGSFLRTNIKDSKKNTKKSQCFDEESGSNAPRSSGRWELEELGSPELAGVVMPVGWGG